MKYKVSPKIQPASFVPNDSWTLFVGRRRVLRIERDGEHPQMWRVQWPDGALSDAVNLTRAKDAAEDFAEGLEARKIAHKSPLKLLGNFSWSRSPVAAIAWRAPETAPDGFFAQKPISATPPTRCSKKAVALPGGGLDRRSVRANQQ